MASYDAVSNIWQALGVGGGGGGVRGGFIPPYVKKALTGPGGATGQTQNPNPGGGGGAGAGGEDEPPFSEQVMRRICPNGEAGGGY
jgi:hypothetical protein